MTPNWFRIVKDYSRLAALTYGPTLPFIVGAIRDPLGKAPSSRAAAQRELHSLLVRMDTEAKGGFGVRIQMCPTLDALVACASGGTSLTWDPYELEDAVGVDALVGKLWKLYGDHICDGNYSKNGKWHLITPKEEARIRAALAGAIGDALNRSV